MKRRPTKTELWIYIIIVIALNMIRCTTVTKPMLTLEMPEPSLELNEQGIPVECYDADGKFDENKGHDYLDCGNLDNRVKF